MLPRAKQLKEAIWAIIANRGLSLEGMPYLKAFTFKMFQKHQLTGQKGCEGLSPCKQLTPSD